MGNLGGELVQVGPARVLDMTMDGTIEAVVRLCAAPGSAVRTAYALHVGGINLIAEHHAGYSAGLRAADAVYADGAAAVLLARAGGAHRIERAATTDIGIPVLTRLKSVLNRPVRVALVGGPPGLAERAGQVLESRANAEVTHTSDGFRRDDEVVAEELRRADPDVVFVGMGVPTEVEWAERMKSLLSATTLITCGGWFGFLVGDERRAPVALRRLNLEWAHRLLLAPKRLYPRYVQGTWNTLRLLRGQLLARRSTIGL